MSRKQDVMARVLLETDGMDQFIVQCLSGVVFS